MFKRKLRNQNKAISTTEIKSNLVSVSPIKSGIDESFSALTR